MKLPTPSTEHVRRAQYFAFVAWLLMVPVAIITGWIYSIAFTGAASIYANAVTHLSGARADVPDPVLIRRLDAIRRNQVRHWKRQRVILANQQKILERLDAR